jgi:NMD protein affecting ribosome stability and mRNA decay
MKCPDCGSESIMGLCSVCERERAYMQEAEDMDCEAMSSADCYDVGDDAYWQWKD